MAKQNGKIDAGLLSLDHCQFRRILFMQLPKGLV